MVNAGLVSHYVNITVYDKSRSSKPLHKIQWNGLPWEVRTKWNWYFRYRAALLQVKYPKNEVEMVWGHVESTGDLKAQQLKNFRTAKKRKITEYENKIKLAKENWTQLFPIEDNEQYKKALQKVNRLKQELEELNL